MKHPYLFGLPALRPETPYPVCSTTLVAYSDFAAIAATIAATLSMTGIPGLLAHDFVQDFAIGSEQLDPQRHLAEGMGGAAQARDRSCG